MAVRGYPNPRARFTDGDNSPMRIKAFEAKKDHFDAGLRPVHTRPRVKDWPINDLTEHVAIAECRRRRSGRLACEMLCAQRLQQP